MARNPIIKAIISDSMWKESDTNAKELVTYPVMSSTKKKVDVIAIITENRQLFPV